MIAAIPAERAWLTFGTEPSERRMFQVSGRPFRSVPQSIDTQRRRLCKDRYSADYVYQPFCTPCRIAMRSCIRLLLRPIRGDDAGRAPRSDRADGETS